jgi:predicted TIM-barrel fold metal-dependent hydrolase
MGSDYPVGDTGAVAFVRKCKALDRQQQDDVLWKNAERLLAKAS